MTAFVILGVSGVGKSTVGSAAAAQLDLPFIEGDDFHPPSNVAKMSAGIALSEEDRMPWIDRLTGEVNRHGQRDLVIACSALTKRVRDRLRSGIGQPVRFIHLDAPAERIQQRLSERSGHFMKARMLTSQLATLEPPVNAARVNTDRSLQAVVKDVVRLIRPDVGS
jgi:gluconokinase